MIRFDNTTAPEIERGYKDIKQACFHDSSHSRLFGNPEDMNAFKWGCIQKYKGDMEEFGKEEYKRFKWE
jgi:hypothetical protein